MSTITAARPQRLDDVVAFPPAVLRLTESFDEVVANNPDLRIEQTVDGEVVIMSPTGGGGGVMNSRFNLDLGNWAQAFGGLVFDSSTLFRLPNGAGRSPDLAWISAERWTKLSSDQQAGYPPLAPDFVAEIRSRTDRLADQQDKMIEYMSVGVRLGWLLDPILRQVHVYKPGAEPIVLDDPQTVVGDDVLPGFVLQVSRIFSI